MISYDTQARRMVDTENGDYLLSQPHDREAFKWSFMLYDRHSQPLLGSVVKVNNIDEFGNSGAATLSRCTLLKTWIPSGQPEPLVYFDEYHSQISRLAAFLEAQLHARGPQTPAPRFEFVDGRTWAESYSQNAQRPKGNVKGEHIFYGLLLTLGLHLLQIALLTRLSKNGEAYFYAGFTQLLYMLPAIYLSRHNRGMMIGLIIGAALTFMLGLPIAALAYICGNMSAHG